MLLHMVGLVGQKQGTVNVHMTSWEAVRRLHFWMVADLEEIREEISAALPKTEAMSWRVDDRNWYGPKGRFQSFSIYGYASKLKAKGASDSSIYILVIVCYCQLLWRDGVTNIFWGYPVLTHPHVW